MKIQILKWAAVLTAIMIITSAGSINSPQANQGLESLRADPSYEEIDAYVEDQLAILNIPGASLVIVEGDQIVHTRGFGVTGPGGDVPTPQTPYILGSLTKSFTALAVMQLEEAGKVELDAPLQSYLPWFKLADPEAAARITVRHLLNQTSGLGMVPGMAALSDFDNAPGAAERQARALAAYDPTLPVGSVFEYSNLNFNLLGLVVEAASGETYADYVQNHIFALLDMENSFTSKSTARQKGLAVGHQQWFGFPVAVPDLPVPEGSLASGQLIASAEDVGHFLIAQLNHGVYDGVQILSPGGIVQMHEPAVEVYLGEAPVSNYGLGWFINETPRGHLVFHDGEVPEYFGYMALLPEQDRAMALLVNTNQQIYNYAMWGLAEDTALWLAGIPPRANAWGILPWAARALLLLPVLQVITIAITLRRIQSWRQNMASRPGPARMWMLHIILPAILDLMLAAMAAAMLFSGMFTFIFLFLGDITSVLLLSGGIALGWLIVRTIMVVNTNRTA